jgi:hypothetical protein
MAVPTFHTNAVVDNERIGPRTAGTGIERPR